MLLVRVALALAASCGATATNLRDAADGRVYMGAAINANYLGQSTYTSTASAQYSLVTAENACKWPAIAPSQNTYNFGQCDQVLSTSQTANQVFRGHNLCWGSWNPGWVEGLSAADKRTTLVSYIETVVGHYKGSVYAWDVVNEPVCDSFPFAAAAGLEICNDDLNAVWKNNTWYPDVPDYVDLAFQTARAADPDALLFLNDYMAESDQGILYKDKADRIYDAAKDMLSRGIPLDGIGMQFHIDLTFSSFDGVKDNMKRLGELGLEVHVTELDVSCSLVDSTCSWDDTKEAKQASIYSQLLAVCLEVEACTSFESWGFTDQYSWRGTAQHPLPFDESYHPKQAVTEMLATLNATSV